MRVLIVGGSSSVGRAVARAFAARGDTVVATHAGSAPDFAAGVQALQLDLGQVREFEDFADACARLLGTIDYCVLLPGILPGKQLADYAPPLLERVMSVNFSAQAALVRALMPLMTEGGSVLAMSSISGQQGSFDPIYAASKAAMIAFVKSMALWHGAKVRFNCIAPGLIEDSTMFAAMSPERRQWHVEQTPTRALLRIGDLAQVIVDLAQPQWRSLNGAVIALNGGRFTG